MTEGLRNAYALLIGIGEYRHSKTVPPLQYAVRDAEALRETLIDPHVCAFPPDQVVLLADADATRDRIVTHLANWLPRKSKQAELVVIYFAGHGTIHTLGPGQQGYLLAHEADPENIVTHGVSMGDLTTWVSGIEAAAVVVCLDCCHAGKVLDPGTTMTAKPRDLELRPHLMQGMIGKGRYLIASCTEGQKSYECDDLQHGLFTYHLLQGLRGAADHNHDDRVGIAELFAYVGAAVNRDAVERFHSPQTPWISSQYGDEAYIARVAARPASGNTWEKDADTATTAPHLAGHLEKDDHDAIQGELRRLKARPDARVVPLLFRCLCHTDEKVRTLARQALHALGWKQAAAAVEHMAKQDDPRVGDVLDGLAAFEAHRDVVALLDRLADLLRGDARNRAILLLERKRLSLGLEQMTQLFADIQSPYQLQRVLGQGLITAVYLARMEGTTLNVVVRVLRRELAGMAHVRAQFLDLCRASLPCIHQSLVMTREVRAFPDHNVYFAVCDHVDGVTLQKAIEGGKRFQPLQIVHLIRQLLGALTPLHERGIPHGGVKPSNIFLCAQDRVLLGDASLPPQGMALDLQRLSYDYRYVAPEATGQKWTPLSDLYALGCVVYELLCDHPPFVDDDHHELVTKHKRDTIYRPSVEAPRVHVAWDLFVGKLLARSPKDRFRDLAQALAGVAQLELALIEATGRKRKFDTMFAGPDSLDRTMGTWGYAPPVAAPPPDAQPPSEPDTVAPLLDSASLDNLRSMVSMLSFKPEKTSGSYPVLPALEATGVPLPKAPVPPTLPHSTLAHTGPYPPPETPADLPHIPGYDIIELVGQGAMGVVYRAQQTALKRTVALKLMRSGFRDTAAAERFKREALAVARLQHPNIVAIYDMGECEGHLYLTLEWCAGGTLADKIAQQRPGQRDAAALVLELALGVQNAHEEGILHRDLKPSNVLLSARAQPKVSDFGLARILELGSESYLTNPGLPMGTPAFMAPEQALGDTARFGPPTDVYGLGAILYTLLTGHPPVGAGSATQAIARVLNSVPDPIRKYCPDIDADLERLCMRCLEKEPAARYPTAAALADDLSWWLYGRSAAAPQPVAEPVRRPPAPAAPVWPARPQWVEPAAPAGDVTLYPPSPPAKRARWHRWKWYALIVVLYLLGSLALVWLIGLRLNYW